MVSSAEAFAEQTSSLTARRRRPRSPFFREWLKHPERVGFWVAHQSPPGDDRRIGEQADLGVRREPRRRAGVAGEDRRRRHALARAASPGSAAAAALDPGEPALRHRLPASLVSARFAPHRGRRARDVLKQASQGREPCQTRSSPAPRPGRSTRRPCRRTFRSRRTRSPRPRWRPPTPAPRSCTCTSATPHDGHPVQDTGLFRELLAEIQGKSDVVINLTTGGSPHMTVDERIGPAMDLAPELASLNMGTMNMGLFPMLDRFTGPRARLGAAAPGEQGPRLQEHLRRHRADPEDVRRPGHPVRVRVLRHRAPVQPGALPRAGPGPAAAVHPERRRAARRHRRRRRGPAAHASYGHPALRRPVRVVHARRRRSADPGRHDRPGPGRQRPGRARGLAVGRARAGSPSRAGSRSSASGPSAETLYRELATPPRLAGDLRSVRPSEVELGRAT